MTMIFNKTIPFLVTAWSETCLRFCRLVIPERSTIGFNAYCIPLWDSHLKQDLVLTGCVRHKLAGFMCHCKNPTHNLNQPLVHRENLLHVAAFVTYSIQWRAKIADLGLSLLFSVGSAKCRPSFLVRDMQKMMKSRYCWQKEGLT